MIHDILPYKFNNQYKTEIPEKNSRIMIFAEGSVAVSKQNVDARLNFPVLGDFSDAGSLKLRYLFKIDDVSYYLLLDGEKESLSLLNHPENFEMVSTQIFRESEPLHESFAGITAYQLYRWYGDDKFCGRCGSRLNHGEKERHLFCPECKNTIYPKISPAVIVGVINGDKLLLTKYNGRAYKRYALIAGFAEIGEPIEDTVKREVMEEVGLKVKNVRFYKSQPWSFTDTLLMGFYCDLDGDDEIKLDTEELSVGEWLTRDEIPETSGRISLTGEMITRFKEGLE